MSSLVSRMTSADSRMGSSSSRSQRDALDDALAAAGEGVAAAGALEAADQHLVGGLEEEHLDPGAGRAELGRRRRRSPRAGRRCGRPRGRPVRSRSPGRRPARPTLVIRAVGMLSITNQPRSSKVAPGLGAAGARQAGDDEELSHASIVAGGAARRRAGPAGRVGGGAGRSFFGGAAGPRGTDWLPNRQPYPAVARPGRRFSVGEAARTAGYGLALPQPIRTPRPHSLRARRQTPYPTAAAAWSRSWTSRRK